jgi:protein TonB
MFDKDLATSAPLRHFRKAVRNWAADQRLTVIPATDHLDHLLLPNSLDLPWYRSLWNSTRELFQPTPPPLDITSKPVLVRDIWGQYGRQKKSWIMSVGLQSAAAAIVLTAAVTPAVVQQVKRHVMVTDPVDLAPPPAKPALLKPHGGGGGGDRSDTPASRGKLAPFKYDQYTPPMAKLPNLDAKLTMDPSLIGPPELKVPNVDMAAFGLPNGVLGPPSNGMGAGGGVGDKGKGGGAGDGDGRGYDKGKGGGTGGDEFNGVYRPGSGGVTLPIPIYKPEPEYAEEARKAKYQGTVQLYVEIDATGRTRNMKVLHGLGLGLDDKAMEAVAKWKFKPGTKDGKPVPVMALIDVVFRLL